MAALTINFFSSLTTANLPPLPLASEKAKGCGYAGQTDAMHTVQYSVANGFNGVIQIQGTLVTDPTETDWYHITALGDGMTVVPDGVVTQNFTGNHVWIRSVIAAFNAGDINHVSYLHN